MNSIERVFCAIKHQEPDKIPRGEFWLADNLLRKMFPQAKAITLKLEASAMETLGLDARVFYPGGKASGSKLDREPAIYDIAEAAKYVFPNPRMADYEKISFWKQETDFFLFALLDGVFQGVASLMDFNTFLMATISHEQKLIKLIAGRCASLIEEAKLAIAAGAHGIIIGDDMAYNRGPYISPISLQNLFFPALEEAVSSIKQLGVPVFFHSDGNLNAIIEDIVAIGFDGIHGLESEAGMDLLDLKKRYKGKLCLMGNLDIGFLAKAAPTEIKEFTTRLVEQAGVSGGFILGSSAGILEGNIPIENLLLLKEIV